MRTQETEAAPWLAGDYEQANRSPVWPQFPHLTSEGLTQHSPGALPVNTDGDSMACVGEWASGRCGQGHSQRRAGQGHGL